MHGVRRALGLSTLAATTVLITAASAVPAQAHAAPQRQGPKNVIVMIGDGMGYNHVAATDYYQYGRTGRQVYETFPVRTGMSTYANGGSYDAAAAWSSFGYVATGATDSSSAATTMSTGAKTYNGAIGVDPGKNPLVHAFQQAEASGRSTGVVTTVEFSHATPAGFVAHNPSRNDYAGIANEMIYRSATDVIIGAGHPCYDANGVSNTCTGTTKYVGGAQAWADLTDADSALGADADGNGTPDPWTLVQTRSQFRRLAHGPAPKRLIGIPQVAETTQQGRSCATVRTNPLTGVSACVDAPYAVARTATVPTLSEMSAAALNVLDGDKDGFALMIEGGAIDWAAHNNAEGRLIEEQIDFNQAVGTVVDWIEEHGGWGENLLVITGDHETGYFTGPGSNPAWTPLVSAGRGKLPQGEFHSGDHTNSLIPFYAKGRSHEALAKAADQRDPVRGRYLDNSELGAHLVRVLTTAVK